MPGPTTGLGPRDQEGVARGAGEAEAPPGADPYPATWPGGTGPRVAPQRPHGQPSPSAPQQGKATQGGCRLAAPGPNGAVKII